MYLDKPIDFNGTVSNEQKEVDIEAKLKANLEHFAKRGNFIPKTNK